MTTGTCIVGIASEGHVYIGGDSASVSGSLTRRTAAPKVFRKGEFVYGYTTSFRMGQAIQYGFNEPERGGEIDPYMRTTFIDALREHLDESGWLKRSDERERGGSFLIGYKGRLFHVGSDFQVTEYQEPYAVVGCGTPYALGALYQTSIRDCAPRQSIEWALEAADHFSTGVRPPFHLVSTESDDVLTL